MSDLGNYARTTAPNSVTLFVKPCSFTIVSSTPRIGPSPAIRKSTSGNAAHAFGITVVVTRKVVNVAYIAPCGQQSPALEIKSVSPCMGKHRVADLGNARRVPAANKCTPLRRASRAVTATTTRLELDPGGTSSGLNRTWSTALGTTETRFAVSYTHLTLPTNRAV